LLGKSGSESLIELRFGGNKSETRFKKQRPLALKIKFYWGAGPKVHLIKLPECLKKGGIGCAGEKLTARGNKGRGSGVLKVQHGPYEEPILDAGTEKGGPLTQTTIECGKEAALV